MPKGTDLTPVDKELIRQTFLILGNKTHTAKKLGLSRRVVVNVLKEQAETGELDRARRDSAIAIAGRIHDKATQILDSIAPHDIESGREIRRNEAGQVTQVLSWGPSLMQKVTAAAILTDKLKVIREYEKAMVQDRGNGQLPMPDDLVALASGIKQKLKSLTFLNVQFARDHPGITEKVTEAMQTAAVLAAAGAEETEAEVIDFDNL